MVKHFFCHLLVLQSEVINVDITGSPCKIAASESLNVWNLASNLPITFQVQMCEKRTGKCGTMICKTLAGIMQLI